jgi:hypothetical protein
MCIRMRIRLVVCVFALWCVCSPCGVYSPCSVCVRLVVCVFALWCVCSPCGVCVRLVVYVHLVVYVFDVFVVFVLWWLVN